MFVNITEKPPWGSVIKAIIIIIINRARFLGEGRKLVREIKKTTIFPAQQAISRTRCKQFLVSLDFFRSRSLLHSVFSANSGSGGFVQ